MKSLMGIETEYGFTALDAAGRRLNDAANELLQAMRDRWPHLRGAGGIFLSNGARFYLDQGKPEFCTPECTDPWEVARYVRAGERMLESAAAALTGPEDGIAEIVLQRCNVDYSGSRTSWGCHESYLYRTAPTELPPQLMPHLSSRVVYTGAGGFNSRAPDTLQFTLSPRVWHLEYDVSPQSTRERGLFHAKDEPLAKGVHRLHLLCGESNCSDTSLWLKVGTTALVVALIDAGLRPGDAVQVPSPLTAMRQFASDPTCCGTVPTTGGVVVSALDIQRHYLECAEAHLGKDILPGWAPAVCERWRSALEQLRGGPEAVATTLDWGIKYALYAARAQRRGIAWALVPVWNDMTQELAAAWARSGRSDPMTYEAVCDPASPVATVVRRLGPILRDHGLAWDDFQAFLALRHELYEIDARFGQLNGKGIFAALNRSGVLDHHVVGIGDVDRAAQEPPAAGRAALRGRLVRELHRDASRYECDWAIVRDQRENRVIDLGDPYATTAEWEDRPQGEEGHSEREQLLRSLQQSEAAHGAETVEVALLCNQLAVCLRSLGRAAEAEPYQRRALELDERLQPPGHPLIPHRLNNLAVVLVMQRRLEEAKLLLGRAWQLTPMPPDLTSARVAWVRLAVAMLEHASPRVFLGQLKSLVGLPQLTAPGNITTIWDHEPIVANLSPSLEAADVELLMRIAATLNHRRRATSLTALSTWRAARALALNVRWPE